MILGSKIWLGIKDLFDYLCTFDASWCFYILKDLFTVSFIVKDNEKNKWENECDTLAKENPIRTA